jgi:hypothetical protein
MIERRKILPLFFFFFYSLEKLSALNPKLPKIEVAFNFIITKCGWSSLVQDWLLSERVNSIVLVQSIKSSEFTQNSMTLNNEQKGHILSS